VFTSPVGGQFVVEYVVCIILIGCWILLTGGNLLSTRREQGRLCLAVLVMKIPLHEPSLPIARI
jgi:hypothetical protein